MREIPLTKGYKAIVDNSDYLWLNEFTWHALDNHGKMYARTAKKVNGKVICTYMHKMINNTPDHLDTDHIDRDTLNNRRDNLRSVTHKENCNNRSNSIDEHCGRCKTRKRINKYWCRPCYNEYQREYRARNK